MELNSVFEVVRDSICEACDIEKEDVTLEKTLFEELAIDSIDLIDFLYILEKHYSISLDVNELGQSVRSMMGEECFTEDNILTAKGLDKLKEAMPEVPREKIIEGLSTFQIPFLLTVHSICNFIIKKINEKNA